MKPVQQELIYDVRERGTYRQYWIPKKQPTTEEKVARGLQSFLHLPFDYSLVPVLIQVAQFRTSFMMQNLSLVDDLWLGLGIVPDPVNSVGIRIAKELAYEPLKVPQNDIWIIGTGVGKAVLIFSVD
jgi:hypothetical protein